MVEAVAAKRQKKAMDLYYDLLALKKSLRCGFYTCFPDSLSS